MEDGVVEIIQDEQEKKKEFEKNESSLRDLWDNIKHTNIHIIGVPEKDRKGQRSYFKKQQVNFLNLGKEINIQWEEAKNAKQEELKEVHTTTIVTKMEKIKDKNEILKSSKRTPQTVSWLLRT